MAYEFSTAYIILKNGFPLSVDLEYNYVYLKL